MVALALACPAQAAEKVTHVAQLSCTTGPYGIRLSKSYKAVRKLAPLKKETLLKSEDRGKYKAQYRLLAFEGLELIVITFSNEPDRYRLSAATFASPWPLTGKLRVGNSAKFALQGLPVKNIPNDDEISFGGDKDSMRVTLSGGNVKEIDYDCDTGQPATKARKSGARR